MVALTRRGVLYGLGALAAGAGSDSVARAQTYPSKPFRVIAGAAPGGPGDFMSRLYCDRAGGPLGQACVVENKPGAGGAIAASAFAKSPADGYTLFASGPSPIVLAPHLNSKLDYDPAKDFVPVAMLGAGGFVLAVHPSVPANTVPELIALAKAQPKDIPYGSGGEGASGHLCTELFSAEAGIQMLHVPYKGDGPAATDLLGGQIKVLFTAPNVVLPHRASGKLKILAVTSRERFASLPDVPAVHETLPGFDVLSWIVLFAPSGTPQTVIEAHAAVWDKARQDTDVKTRLDGYGMYPPPRYATRDAVAALIASERDRLGALIKKLGIQQN